MEDTTVLIIMDTGMARDKLRMRLLPQDQTLMPMLMLMAGVSFFIYILLNYLQLNLSGYRGYYRPYWGGYYWGK